MKSIVDKIQIGNKPNWLTTERMIFETESGSNLYQTQDENSDKDVLGICVPPPDTIFLPNFIHGFDEYQAFNQLQMTGPNCEVDYVIYSAGRFCQLAMLNNPNITEILFIPNCGYIRTPLFEKLYNIRHEFLCQKLFHSFIGYAYAQMSKLENKNPIPDSRRDVLIKKFGYDTKYAYHCVRLALYGIDLATKQNIEVAEHAQLLKDIKNGKYSISEIRQMFDNNLARLKQIEKESSLPKHPNKVLIRETLEYILRGI